MSFDVRNILKGKKVRSIAVVKFPNNFKKYDFRTDIPLSIGDKVVVDTAMGAQIGTVQGFKDKSEIAHKWVIQKLDLDAHEDRLALVKKKEAIKAEMEKRRQELVEDMAVYEALAETDPTMATLYKEYQKLA